MILTFLQAVLYGVIQGVTEWLPVSSTGHMLIFDNFAKPQVSEAFWDLFLVVVQLASICAVISLFWKRINPFLKEKDAADKKRTYTLWGKVLVASVPAAIAGFLFQDLIEGALRGNIVIAITLILLGIGFLFMGRVRTQKTVPEELAWKKAFYIGCFQMLSLIPGTSRSGSTIFGATLLGVERKAAAEFSFLMAIPIMLGASGYKLLKFLGEGVSISGKEALFLIVSCLISFVVSIFAVRFLMDFVKKHSFAPFGWYRIILGALLLILIVTGALPAAA